MLNVKRLAAVPLFQTLSPPRRQRLSDAAVIEFVKRGVVLFQQGNPAATMWVVLNGWVHLVRSGGTAADRPVVIFTITPAETLCGISALAGGRYSVTAIAGTHCQVARLPAALLTEALTHEAAFTHAVLQLCIRRLQHIAQQYGSMAEPVSHRLIRSLLRLRQQFGATVPVTHRELAQMSWTTTESAIRIVRSLKQQGYVSGTRGQMTIAHPDGLEHLLSGSNGHGRL